MLRENWNDAGPGFHPVSASDYLPAAQLRELQLRRLKHIVGRAYAHVPLFRERMDARGLTPASIESLADLGRLPFTVKADLRDTYPFGLFASPMSEIVRLHASSGTTGKPIVVAYTAEDIEVWSSVMLRTFAAAGISRGDIVQNAFGYGLFTGGLGAHYGLEALGATVVPVSGGQHRPAGDAAAGFPGERHLRHAELLPAPHRTGRRARHRPARAAAAGGHLRRRAMDAGDAGAHRGRRGANPDPVSLKFEGRNVAVTAAYFSPQPATFSAHSSSIAARHRSRRC